MEQAVPPQPMSTVRSRSPPAAMEEPMVQQWMWPGGTWQPMDPCRNSLRLELQPMGESIQECRDRIRKAETQMQSKLVRKAEGKKDFYRYSSNKRKTKRQ